MTKAELLKLTKDMSNVLSRLRVVDLHDEERITHILHDFYQLSDYRSYYYIHTSMTWLVSYLQYDKGFEREYAWAIVGNAFLYSLYERCDAFGRVDRFMEERGYL